MGVVGLALFMLDGVRKGVTLDGVRKGVMLGGVVRIRCYFDKR